MRTKTIIILHALVWLIPAGKTNYAAQHGLIQDPIQMNLQTKIFDQIVFAYRGPSVAPQYHRCYVITVDSTHAKVMITDYTNTLMEKIFAIKKIQWDKLVKMAQYLRQEGKKISDSPGAHSKKISLNLKNNSIFSFEWDSLQVIEKETQNLTDEIHKTIPGFQQLLDNS